MKSEHVIAIPAAQTSAVLKEGFVVKLMGLVVILVVMNTTMFNIALPQVAADLALKVTTASWVVTGYSIVFAIFSITYSRLSDFIPIRSLIVIGLFFMGAGSLLGLFSHHFPRCFAVIFFGGLLV